MRLIPFSVRPLPIKAGTQKSLNTTRRFKRI